ncbi:amidohydrolase family protein [Methylobacterium pseudosasicola]|uniref:Predicted metal-dependent hydrolase, TIM-barrel fold n=1 Tax=Methylobacterium pseudosasicola TaxID=582667 RepID=A0A1I4TVF5_9HYPH|nr:amidohydrolase family protein [Methylobacterium pseudosasicola]SFM80694.1 Predicted metal-dependent hydrolase, TIM-barrel fold [Methylobacterium pseudosasicola]
MLSRRQTLALALANGLALTGPPARAAGQAAAPTVKTAVSFPVPPGACDCHVHVIPDPAKFPFWEGRAYTPPVDPPESLLALQHALKLDRVVIVTPSVYGTDNAATLDGLRLLGPERARGVAVIGPRTGPAELDALAQAGIRGIRVNLEQAGVFDPAASAKALDSAVQQIGQRPWHLQVYSRLSVIGPLKQQLSALPVPVVFDHFAGAQAALGPDQPGFNDVLDLVRSGKAWVKLSGAYRASDKAPDYPDVTPLARALVAANPDRLVWGSDWPHPDSVPRPDRKPTDLAPAQDVDDGRLLDLLAVWVPERAIRDRILVENPKRLYDF